MALAGARDFPALAHSLYFHLREDFAVPHVALRVWGKRVPADFDEAEAVSEAQRQQAERHGRRRSAARPRATCSRPGSARPPSTCARSRWCRSARRAVFGLLALGSEDPQRFFPEMGTLYLRRIGELCAAGVTARL